MSSSVAATRPADVRIMAIVHWALQRDLARLRAELTTAPYPVGVQRRALGDHGQWLMTFLHEHHRGEDSGLWPLVLERNPDAGPLLESLEADHARIAPAADALRTAARAYATTPADDARQEYLARLDALTDVLVPHLDREVSEGMPVVAATLSDAEWQAWDEKANIKPHSLRQLGIRGHWLLDGIDRDGYQVVVHLVPPVPRFILLRGFARLYRRQAAARWRASVLAAAPV